MRLTRPLVLASGSPRRRRLLEEAGLSFRVAEAPPETEDFVEGPVLPPAEAAERKARAKAEWAARRHPGAFVLGADTVVILDGEGLGKPADEADARRMLGRLSGRTHEVVTAFAVVGGGRARTGRVATRVRFRALGEDAIARYAASGEPMDKAGAYAVQGAGGGLVDAIEGSYTNVVGLPLPEVIEALAACGALEGGPPVSA